MRVIRLQNNNPKVLIPYQQLTSVQIMNHNSDMPASYLNKRIVGGDTKWMLLDISSKNQNVLTTIIFQHFKEITFLA